MNSKLLCAFFALAALSASVAADSKNSYRAAFGALDRELAELEIDLKQLDLQLSKAVTYGWREDAAEKIAEWRNSLKESFARFRNSLANFFKNLTTRDGNSTLPDWVYTAASGALDEVVTYLESRMANEDDHVRSIILEVLRNSVRVYRNKVRTASQKGEIAGEAIIKEEL